MKTSTKILLAGLVPVILFVTANIAVNRIRAERIAPEVKKLSAALDLATVRVVDLRGTFTPEEIQQITASYEYWQDYKTVVMRAKGVYLRTSATPASDWLRRSGDEMIVSYPGTAVTLTLPNLEELKVNGTTIRTWESETEEEAPQDTP